MKLDYEVKLECLPEDMSVEDSAMVTDDPEADREYGEFVTLIREQLQAGNQWAWFCAHVTVTLKDFCPTCSQAREADEYLGGCSYTSEESFRASDEYKDMVQGCLGILTTPEERA